ncbi:MAG: hypothetical protein ACI86S_001394 [Paracoccaceae bacterium]|jgi:hypothetical protein
MTHHIEAAIAYYPIPAKAPIVVAIKWGKDPRGRDEDRICVAPFAETSTLK